jgi:hypothetical protein
VELPGKYEEVLKDPESLKLRSYPLSGIRQGGIGTQPLPLHVEPHRLQAGGIQRNHVLAALRTISTEGDRVAAV